MSRRLAFGIEQMFSLASRERCLTNMKRAVRPKLGIKPSGNAAVLVPLCRVDNVVCILYTVRGPDLNPNSAHFTFPGGLLLPNESAIKAALRETEEKIGLSPAKIDVWGSGSHVPARHDLAVTPVLASIPKLSPDDITLNFKEVSQCFAVPVQMLCDPKNQFHTRFKNGYVLPVFMVRKYKIWGVTAFITHSYLSSILHTNVYKNEWAKKKVVVEVTKHHS